MSENSDLSEAIKQLGGFNDLEFESKICVVSEIDLTENTCTCTPVDGTAKFFDVDLSQNLSKGFLLIPANGSRVVCAQTSETTAYISMVSDVSQVYIAGDVNGGLVKVVDLVTKLNNIENAFNTHLAAYTAHVHAGVTAGIGVTGITTPATNTLTPTVRSNIENTIVKHGNG